LDRFLQFPIVSEVSAKSLPDFKRGGDAVAVGYIAAEDKESKRQFELLAKTIHPEYVFGFSDDPKLAKAEGIEMPRVVVYKDSDAEKNNLSLTDDLDDMVANLRFNARPLIVDLVFEIHEDLLDVSWQRAEPEGNQRVLLIAYSRWVSRLATSSRIHLKNEHAYARKSNH
jgi:hypothetical protein